MNVTLIKDKDEFVKFAENHTIPQIAEHFSLTEKYVKNYVCNHKIAHKKLDLWHGMSNHRLYNIYRGMIARCYNPKHVYYKYYGERGISVCEEWRNDRKLFFDWAMKNGYKDNLQIDRIDCDKDYESSNCRFVSNLENQNNRRCNIKVYGVQIGVISADKECNPLCIPEYLVYKRVTGDGGRLRKWSIELALATPVNKVKGSHKVMAVDKNVLLLVEKGLMKYKDK